MPGWIIGTVVTGGTLSTTAVVTIGVVLCVTCAEEDTGTVAGCGAVSDNATVTGGATSHVLGVPDEERGEVVADMGIRQQHVVGR